MSHDFILDPHLHDDTFPVGDLSLSRVLLMNDRRFPWLILVPRRAAATEIVDLLETERAMLMDEIAAASRALKSIAPCDKLNVGALGNVVPQLHIHVVARLKGDCAWPGPVWGSGRAEAYAAGSASELVDRLRRELGL